MRRILLQFVFVLLVAFSASANELSLSDTLSSQDDLSVLLKSNDYFAKANFINQLYSPAYLGGLKSYAENLQLDSIVFNVWSDESQKVEKSQLYTCSFENEGKSVLVSISVWDASKGKWIIGDENYYEFNEEGRIKQIEFQEYVFPGYRLYTRIDYEYENDLLKFESRFDRIDEIEYWDEIEQYEYEYNDNNALKTVYINEWDTYENDWAPFAFRTFAYDGIGNLTTETGYDHDYYDNISEKKFELKYTYDNSSNLTEITEYIPGWEEGVFVPERLQVNVYDTSSTLKRETFYNWSYDADDWVGEVQRLYSDETDGMRIYETTSYLWSPEDREWQGSEKLEYLTDDNYYTSDIQYWDFLNIYMPVYSFNSVVCDKIDISNYENDDWNNSGWTDYYFSDGTLVGVDELTNLSVNVYPNPVVDVLNIETGNFDETTCILRDLNGRVILQTTFQNHERINLSWLTSGIYFVELSSKTGKPDIHKMIKR